MLLNTFQKFSLATAGAAVLSFGLGEAAFAVGFSGSYDPANWTLTNDNADGYVDTSNAPLVIVETGGDNSSVQFGQTSYTTTAAASGLVSFDWDYSSFDSDGAFWDPFGILLNGVFTQLSEDNGPSDPANLFDNQNGSYSFNVSEGDIFGFAIQTVDNIFGRATVEISNFNAPQNIPEPGTVVGLLAVGLGGTVLRRRQEQSKNS